MKRIVIAGGSGFLGQILSDYFEKLGYQITILSRTHHLDHGNTSYVKWDGKSLGYWIQPLEGAEALINLNGKSVDCRYHEANKQLIYDTRIEATYILGEAIKKLEAPPKVWINAASATIYRHSLDMAMDEVSGELGEGFSVDVCKKWEEVFTQVACPDTRKVILRTAVVLGKEGGALIPLKKLAKMGLGGKQGSGEQYFSWIHEIDFCRVVKFVLDNKEMQNVFNVASPHPIPNRLIMKEIRRQIGVPFGLPLPQWLLSIGALMINTETELILKSRRVIPQRLTANGFSFEFEDISEALKHLIAKS